MSNLKDLNNHLFGQLDRLKDENLKGDELKEEIERSKAVSSIAATIINNGNLVLKAKKFSDDRWDADSEIPKMLEG